MQFTSYNEGQEKKGHNEIEVKVVWRVDGWGLELGVKN